MSDDYEDLKDQCMNGPLWAAAEIARLKAEAGRDVDELYSEVVALEFSVRDKDDEIERLRANVKKQQWSLKVSRMRASIDKLAIARLEGANQQWCDKWERLQCESCGTSNSLQDTP